MREMAQKLSYIYKRLRYYFFFFILFLFPIFFFIINFSFAFLIIFVLFYYISYFPFDSLLFALNLFHPHSRTKKNSSFDVYSLLFLFVTVFIFHLSHPVSPPPPPPSNPSPAASVAQSSLTFPPPPLPSSSGRTSHRCIHRPSRSLCHEISPHSSPKLTPALFMFAKKYDPRRSNSVS